MPVLIKNHFPWTKDAVLTVRTKVLAKQRREILLAVRILVLQEDCFRFFEALTTKRAAVTLSMVLLAYRLQQNVTFACFQRIPAMVASLAPHTEVAALTVRNTFILYELQLQEALLTTSTYEVVLMPEHAKCFNAKLNKQRCEAIGRILCLLTSSTPIMHSHARHVFPYFIEKHLLQYGMLSVPTKALQCARLSPQDSQVKQLT
jgi:hypothetical protein